MVTESYTFCAPHQTASRICPAHSKLGVQPRPWFSGIDHRATPECALLTRQENILREGAQRILRLVPQRRWLPLVRPIVVIPRPAKPAHLQNAMALIPSNKRHP